MNYKNINIILVFFVSIFIPFGNQLLAQEKAKFTCYFSPNLSGDQLCEDMKALSYSDEIDARDILQKVLEPVGLRPNFVLQPCDSIENCVATIGENGWRFILYDRVFLKKLVSKDGTNWSSLSIFAHEVLHHLNQHTHLVQDASLQKRRQMELEADEWSGRILGMLGANLDDAQAAIKSLNYTYDETFSSHPSKEQRLAAIEKGFQSGSSTLSARKPKLKIELEDMSMQYHQFLKLTTFGEADSFQKDGWIIKDMLFLQNNPYIFSIKDDTKSPNKIHETKNLDDLKSLFGIEDTWINKLNFFQNQWYGLQDSNDKRHGQTIRSTSSLDLNDFQIKKALGTIISDISFANNQWVILEENKEAAQVDDQLVQITDAFPANEISQLWKNFYIVATCKFLNNQWITVYHKFTKEAIVLTQVQGYKSTFPLDEIIKYEKEGYRLEMADFDGFYWGYIMNKFKNFTYENVKQ